MSVFVYDLAGAVQAPFAQFLLDAAVKATVLLLAAMAATELLRRSSAAVRHRIWCLTFAALVLLPGLSAALPNWRLAVLPQSSPLALRAPLAAQAEGALIHQTFAPFESDLAPHPVPLVEQAGYGAQADHEVAEQPGHVETFRNEPEPAAVRPPGLAGLWLTGAVLLPLPVVVGLARTSFLRRRSVPINDAQWRVLLDELRQRLALVRQVGLYENSSALMPMTWGVLRPLVMLPQQAHAWTDRLRRIVLLHELAHVKRCDVGCQLLGRIACALYWFHPLAWYALRRLRIERELACDDCVVLAGERATDYAAELVQIARAYRTVPFAAAVAMAQRSNLEHRLRAMFDRACSHLPLGARTARILLAGVLVLVTTVAAVRLAPRAAADEEKQADAGAAAESPQKETPDDAVSRRLSGRVVDEKGQPVDGARVMILHVDSESGVWINRLRTLADANTDRRGEFSISYADASMFVAREHFTQPERIVPPDDEPYFRTEVHSPKRDGLGPVQLDVALKRASWLRGRVTDAVTGKPLRGLVEYYPFLSNTAASEYPNFVPGRRSVEGDRYPTGEDGTFRLPAVPGRGLLAFIAKDADRYPESDGADKIADLRQKDGRTLNVYEFGSEELATAVREVSLPAEGGDAICDIELKPLDTAEIKLVDPEGQPLVGAVTRRGAPIHIAGWPYEDVWSSEPLPTATAQIVGSRDQFRTLMLLHRARQIAAAVLLSPGSDPPRQIVLRACGSISGRVIDAEHRPVADLYLVVKAVSPDERPTGLALGSLNLRHRIDSPRTDQEGGFRIGLVPPGIGYVVSSESGPARFEKTTPLIQPGQSLDLGDLVLAVPGEDAAAQRGKAAENGSSAKNATDSTVASAGESADAGSGSAGQTGVATLRGRVLDPAGKPLSGARLYLSYPTRTPLEPQLLGRSGDEGRFEFQVDVSKLDRSYMADPWTRANLTAAAEGYGVEWTEAAKAAAAGDFDLQVVKEVPIRGRILTLEGKPVAGAKIRLRRLRIPVEKSLDAYIEAQRTGRTATYRFERAAATVAGVPETAIADEQGRFTLAGYGAERVVDLFVEGAGIEHSYVFVMTRETEAVVTAPDIAMREIPDRSYGATFDYLVPPGRTIVGAVRERGTHKPVAGVLIQCIGQTTHRPKTDDQGRFELLGVGKAKEYNLDAKAEGLPYFSTRVRIDDTPGLDPINVEIELDRGIQATGRVTLAASGKPNLAQVEYYPLMFNPYAERTGSRLATPCSSAACDDDGRYTLPVLPGPGILTYRFGPYSRTTYREYMPAWLSKQEIEAVYESAGLKAPADKTEGFVHVSVGQQTYSSIITSNYNHAELINPREDEASLSRNVELQLGRKLSVKVVSPEGRPASGAKVRGVGNHTFEVDNVDGSEFTVIGLNPRIERDLIVELPEKKLGVYRVLRGDEGGPIEVRLQPCGSIVGRLVDEDGEPVANRTIGVGRPRLFPAEFTPTTDAEGRFRVDGLVPGLEYEVGLENRGSPQRKLKDATLMPGEERSLGDVSTKPN